MLQFLQTIITFLHRENIAYMLSGSVAMSTYVVPRATRDIDFIISLRVEDVVKIANAFSFGYYCDADAVEDAVNKKGIFNTSIMLPDLRPTLWC